MPETNAAPRITPEDIEAEIAVECYFTAAQGVRGATPPGLRAYVPPPGLELVTMCALVLRNGTKIIGVNYGPIDPMQFDAERGRELARADAIQQCWPLLGYALRERLHRADLYPTTPST